MVELRDLQERCYRAFVCGEDQALLSSISSRSIDRAASIAIYQNNALENYSKTLANVYPAIQSLVGQPCFRTLCRDYVRRYPSTSGNLDSFGSAFCKHISSLYGGTEFSYLADVARLEWSAERALQAANSPLLNVHSLAEVAATALGDIVFHCQAALRLVCSSYPVLSIWKLALGEKTAGAVDIAQGGEAVIVCRSVGKVAMYAVDRPMAQFTQAIARGRTLAEATDQGLSFSDSFDPGAALALLFGWDCLSSFSMFDSPQMEDSCDDD